MIADGTEEDEEKKNVILQWEIEYWGTNKNA
jgi:hypothetical protein